MSRAADLRRAPLSARLGCSVSPVLTVPSVPSVIYDDTPSLDDRTDRLRSHANEIDRLSIHHHRIHLLAGFQAADASLPIERAGGVETAVYGVEECGGEMAEKRCGRLA